MNGKKSNITIILIIAIMGSLLTGCSKKDAIVGTWKDENDIVKFYDDDTFSASYYWIGGSYVIDGDNITLSPTLLDNEEYSFNIQNDTLSFNDIDSGDEIYIFEKVKY